MGKRKEWQNLLKIQLEKDNSILINITSKDKQGNIIDLGSNLNNIKIKRDDKCIINCRCGRICKEKAVREVIKKDALCIFCRHPGERWDNRALWEFYNEKIKENLEENKDYTWWQLNHRNFVSALQSHRKEHPKEDLPFLSIKTSRAAGGKYLWKEALEIYEEQGVKGLTKKNLDNKDNFYTFIVKKKKIPKTKRIGNVNYPCVEVCKKLKEVFTSKCKNILDERKQYLKKVFPIECESFEEMCEIHIRPILNEILKSDNLNGAVLVQQMFTQNNYCSIFNAYRVKFKKKTVDVRKYFNLPLCSKNKCVSYQMYMCDSIAEMRVYNFLYLRNICVYEKENYEGDLSNYVDDGRFFCEKKQKWIIIEVFGDNRGNYEERKNKKLNYWKNNKNENLELLSLSYEDTTKKNTLIKLFEPYIGIIEENKLSEDFLEEMKKLNYHNASIIRRNKIIKECMEIKKNEPDGFLPAISQLPSHIRNYISNVSFDGGINEFRKLLGEDIDEAKKLVKKKGIDKMKKTKKNWSIQQKQAAIENHKKSHYSNKSKNQKIIICKKMSDAAKKRFSNPTNNPMYGKKGKDNPNFGKKYGSYDYKKRFLPLFAKLLVELDKNAENNIIFITESIWQKHAKTIKGCPEKPYRNPSEYNPWKETEFDGFFNDTKQYIKEKNIIINSRLMNVKNTRWAKLHYKRRKQVIDFIKENKRLPLRKENSTLYEWFRLLTTRPRSEEPYIKEGVEAINIVIKKFIK